MVLTEQIELAIEGCYEATLMPAMRAGRQLLRAFSAHPGLFHRVLGTPLGWRVFRRFCTGEISLDQEVSKFPIRATLNVLGRTRRAPKAP